LQPGKQRAEAGRHLRPVEAYDEQLADLFGN
jgi:hypothetical protein